MKPKLMKCSKHPHKLNLKLSTQSAYYTLMQNDKFSILLEIHQIFKQHLFKTKNFRVAAGMFYCL